MYVHGFPGLNEQMELFFGVGDEENARRRTRRHWIRKIPEGFPESARDFPESRPERNGEEPEPGRDVRVFLRIKFEYRKVIRTELDTLITDFNHIH